MAKSDIAIDIKLGPNVMALSELLDAIDAAIQVIPDWHAEERNQLLLAAIRLNAACARELRERKIP